MSSFTLPIDKKSIAMQTARMMLEIKAIHFNAEQPFIFTSGWASPLYVDCRKLISYPRLRSALMDFAANTILTEIGYESIDVITGGE
ncbi:MAG TPA: orotate phosphoribosyltransferase, partial [Beijerinckiaceae bacterium]|nr:orotate phosphoribosyltransferase [Beijerinckiaceae bacterium]